MAYLNEELELACPDGFRIRGKEETGRKRFNGKKAEWVISDPDRRIVISVQMEKIRVIAGAFTGIKDAVLRRERKIGWALLEAGYRTLLFFTRELDGNMAEGFRYVYTELNTGMEGEVLIIRNRRNFYYISSLFCRESEEESLKVLEEFYRTLHWY